MKKLLIRSGFVLLVVLGIVAYTNGPTLAQTLGLGAAYAAKSACSGVFISGRSLESIHATDMNAAPIPIGMIDVDEAERSVTVRIGPVSRTAIYRENCGCTVVQEMTVDQLRAQAVGEPLDRPELNAEVAWPIGKSKELATVEGIDADQMSAAMESAFAESSPDQRRDTRGIVIVHDGKLVAERYAPGYHDGMPLTSWSMTKTVTAILAGILVGDGKLDIHAPAPVPEWQDDDDPRAAITLDHLLRMSSGLKFQEEYSSTPSDVVRMLYEQPDAAAFAASMPLSVPPDTRWSYSSGTTNIIARIIRNAIDGDQAAYYRFVRERLFDPLGISSATMEADSSGTLVGSSFMYCTPRDWARLGQFLMQDGVWNDQRILPEGWVDYMTTPTPAASKGQYGAQTWLNVGEPEDSEQRRLPSCPTDLFFLSGFEGQRVFVVPSRKTVIVRMGMTPDESTNDWDRIVADFLAALPEPSADE